MRLRDYQENAVQAIRRTLQRHRGALCVLPTGTGKSVVAAHVAHQEEGRVLFVAHMRELLQQAGDKVKKVTGDHAGLEMGPDRVNENAWSKHKVVTASIQSLHKRKEKFKPGEFSLVIIDEGHHAAARTFRELWLRFKANPACRLLLMTATPQRGDGLTLRCIEEDLEVACDYPILQANEDGWLVPARQQVVVVDGLDFSDLKTVDGDFTPADLERLLCRDEPLHRMVAPMVEIAGSRPTLFYGVNRKHALAVSEIVNAYRPGQAAYVDGKTPDDTRAACLRDFKNGRIQFLCLCQLYLEGMDAPTVGMVAVGRSTKSLGRYQQMVGRGLRVIEGPDGRPIVDHYATPQERKRSIEQSAKRDCIILDFAGNAGRHKIVRLVDLLGGKYAEPVREYARRTGEDEPERPMLVDDSLARAAAELALEEEEAEMRRRITASVEFRVQDVDLFDERDRAASSASPVSRRDQQPPATEAQVWKMKQLGYSEGFARSRTKRAASGIISKGPRKTRQPEGAL